MALVFIIMLFVWHEFSADRFHKNYDNIYRIESAGGSSVTYPAGTIISEAIPEVKKSSLMYSSILYYSSPDNDNSFKINYNIVDNEFSEEL